ncbi:MAG: RluA family pseudouridine synthase, partial [Pseudomonadota bacterium]
VYIGLVHRLDRPASGIMVLARTSKAASRLSAQFRAGKVKKKYFALVEGACPGQGTAVNYLIKKDRQVSVVEDSRPGAQYAELFWEALAQKNNLTLLAIDMKTGRPHQIRVQLSHLGFPILGDLRYGAKKKFDGLNLALHCYLLGLEHPVKKEPMQWTALPPSAWSGMFDNETAAAAAILSC